MQIWRALLCHGKVYFYSFEGAIKKSLFVAGKCSATHKQNEENDFVHLVLELLQFNELIQTQIKPYCANYFGCQHNTYQSIRLQNSSAGTVKP